MPHLSLALALVIVAGLAGGVLVDTPLTSMLSVMLAAGWIIGVASFLWHWPHAQLVGLGLSVVAAAWLVGGHALDRALHPSLRVILEQRLGGFSIDRLAEGRQESPVTIEGRLRGDAVLTETGAIARIDVERVWLGPCPEPAAGGISVGIGGAMQAEHVAQWTEGRVIRAPVLLRRPARYLNQGLPDQERAFARRGVTLVGTIKSAAVIEVVARGRWWDEAAARVRANTRAALARHVRPRGEQSAAVATAILIGDRTALDIEVERRLQEAGTYHVIAISGGNIAILAGLLLGTLAWLGLRGRMAALATIVALGAYAIVAAGGASVARATLMAVVYLAVRLIDQRTAAANAIGLTGTAILLIDPLSIADVGFWLTFGATTAIRVGVASVRLPAASEQTRRTTWLLRAAATVLLASACVELALAPISAMVFQRVTVAGLLLNFAALPAMTIVQIAAMCVIAFDAVGLQVLAGWAGVLVHLGSVALTDSARFLDYAPWLTWRVPSPLVAVVVAYYAMLALTLASVRFARVHKVPRRLAAGCAGALLLWIIAAPHARVRAYGDQRLHLTVIDVGQGDAMLVTFPNGRRLIVDTGGVTLRGEFDVGDRVIGPALRAGGLLSLDYLAVTHGDPDHIGGARSLVRDFQPREIWWGVPVANHQPTATVHGEASRTRGSWRTLQRGDRLDVGGVELRVHHPPPADWERQKVRNDDSLVLELRYGHVSMLLTGDIGRDVERELLPLLDLLPIVVLKVAHHGSGTSSAVEFVEHVKPTIALIGVGRGNPYGHPVPYILERFHRIGAQIFRTDTDGQIEVSTDGRRVDVSTFTERRFSMQHEGHEEHEEQRR
jgi:competence protein ComEC